MKIFQITDTEKFFNRLSQCRGEVQVVGKNGSSILLGSHSDSEKIELLRNVYGSGTIDQIELKFTDNGDVINMISFMTSMNVAA